MVEVYDHAERQVNEHDLRVSKSRAICVMMISMISWGRRQVDSCTMDASGDTLPGGRLILTLPWCQAVFIRVERPIPTVRTAQRLEPFTRTGW
jgi:hypothetical protein